MDGWEAHMRSEVNLYVPTAEQVKIRNRLLNMKPEDFMAAREFEYKMLKIEHDYKNTRTDTDSLDWMLKTYMKIMGILLALSITAMLIFC